MSVNSKMTALANAIRSKSNTTGKLSIDGMTEAVRNIETGITPSGTLEHWIGGGNTEEVDVADYATISITAYNSYIYESVDTLPDYPSEGTLYGLPDGTYWMKAYSGFDEYGNPYGIKCAQCYIEADAFGGDAPAPIVEQAGSTIRYENITEVSTSTITEPNVCYTAPDGQQYMLAMYENGTPNYVPCSVWTGANGYDVLVPIINWAIARVESMNVANLENTTISEVEG